MTWLFFSVITIIVSVVYAAWKTDSIFYFTQTRTDYRKGGYITTTELSYERVWGYTLCTLVLAALGPIPIMLTILAAPLVGLFLYVRKLTRKK